MTNQNNPPMLVCYVTHLNAYQGKDVGFFPSGFKYPKEHGWAAEFFNFTPIRGRVYGFFENGRDNLSINKLGASKGAHSIGGITVLWTAPSPCGNGRVVVGAYRNATVHRSPVIPDKNSPMGRARTENGNTYDYYIEAAVDDAKLLTPSALRPRVMKYARTEKGRPGQRSVFYASDSPRADYYAKFVRSIFDIAGPLQQKLGSGRRKKSDYAANKLVEEAAVDAVRKELIRKGYEDNIYSVEADKCGYDLVATFNGSRVGVEVKGRSSDECVVGFTPRELKAIKSAQSGKFKVKKSQHSKDDVNATLILAVVTLARTKPNIRLFQCFKKDHKYLWLDTDRREQLLLVENPGAVGTGKKL